MEFNFDDELDDLAIVPDHFKHLYADNNGKFAVTEPNKGVLQALRGLNTSLKASRLEAKNLKGSKIDLSALAEFGDNPADISAAVKAKIDELTASAASNQRLNLDKIKEDLSKAHAAELTKHTTRNAALKDQLYGLIVETQATAAIAEHKGVSDLLMPFVKPQINVSEEDGKFIYHVVDAQGDIRYSGITGLPMTVKELIAEMKTLPKYARLFESDLGSGGGTPPGSGRKPSSSAPASRDNMSAVDKIKAGLNRRSRR